MRTYFLVMLLGSLLASHSLRSQQPLRVDPDRLEESLQELARFGRDAEGQPNRVAFSEGDLEGRSFVIGLMKTAGLETRIDAAGNIIGRRAGTNPALPALAMGSHIDMVPNGGNYDGCLGSLAAIEVIRTLEEAAHRTTHPLEVIVFSNEEGGVMGSRAMVGTLKPEALDIVNSTGYSMGEGIQRLGGDTTRLQEAIRTNDELTAFLELHIEQGGILHSEQLDIGIVEGIVGLNWWDVTVKGFANHAGTTPMRMRRDALLSAAKLIAAVNEEALGMDGQHVATVGRIRAYPGAPNVIPGEVVMSLEIRDLSTETIWQLFEKIQARAEAIGQANGTTFHFEALDTTGKPALTDQRIQQTIEEVSESLGLSSKRMRSGAGHDAQDLALIAPVGMIFVPSKDGISHSPEEYTNPADMANGANVLLHTLLELDQGLD